MANVLRYPLAAATCRALARDFRANAILHQREGEARKARACERIARRYDARAARLTYEARGSIIPPAAFGGGFSDRTVGS